MAEAELKNRFIITNAVGTPAPIRATAYARPPMTYSPIPLNYAHQAAR
ncbi:hypothetical protein ACFC08_31520 [Streptomyces sp. NPDC056112]|nr:hypothetical protein [Streptomyces sp. CoT10]